MKKFLILIGLVSFLMVSCDADYQEPRHSKEYYHYKLITLTFDGDTPHEYVISTSTEGITHYPGCKYCKKM